jgi:hypothetical protein
MACVLLSWIYENEARREIFIAGHLGRRVSHRLRNTATG